MKQLLFLVFLAHAQLVLSQSIVGKWVTVDDKTNKNRSVVEIYEVNGKYYGKITKIFLRPGEPSDAVCEKCAKSDARYNEPILGMVIIRNMRREGEKYGGGKILDPESGNEYTCVLWLENGQLMVRGYYGIFSRTQTWKRLQ